MLDVAALGELLIDFTCLSTDENGYPTMAAHPGGAPANFLAAIARLGGRTALLSKVGADAFGTMLTGTLREVGVEQDPALVRCCAAAAVDGSSMRYSSYRSPASSRASRASGLSSCSMMQASSRRA